MGADARLIYILLQKSHLIAGVPGVTFYAATDGYDAAESKLRLEPFYFVAGLKVKRS
jgi:hypothetical protein